jgi:hypothetical protein
VKVARNLLEVIRTKLATLMGDYASMDGQHINGRYNEFVEWSLEFVSNIHVFMREVSCPMHEEIPIEVMREMCDLYWDYLKGLKELNLVIIYNLDLDLSFIYRYCAAHFPGNVAILDRFKSLREFYALMLTNNLQDYADPDKRHLSYPNLNT